MLPGILADHVKAAESAAWASGRADEGLTDGPDPRAKFGLERHERKAVAGVRRPHPRGAGGNCGLKISGADGRLPDRMARAKRAHAPACNPKAAVMVRGRAACGGACEP
jgi:hypothetical protein